MRRLEKIDLWEISIVTFPMLPEARVSSLKARRPFCDRSPTEREFERWLTQDAGFTRREARAVVRAGFKGLEAPAGRGAGHRLGSAPAPAHVGSSAAPANLHPLENED